MATSEPPRLTLQELREIAQACRAVIPQTLSGMERNSLRHVIDAVADVALVTTTALHIFNNEKGAKPAHPIGLGTELNLTLY